MRVEAQPIEAQITQHYGHGRVERAILEALRAAGKDVEHLTTLDLSAADEFHLGWRAVTAELGVDLGLRADQEVLDVGSGIGGPARYFAEAHGARVTGVDLTAEYVAVATELTRRCGLEQRASFVQGSALALPFAEARFEVATLIHVGMNIEDKAGLFREVRRVLSPGGLFGVYDVMKIAEAELPYPMPWAETPATSFVETAEIYRALLAAEGFAIEAERNRRDQTLELARAMRAHREQHGTPPLGLHVLMGPATPQRLGNVMIALENGSIAPVQILARAI